VPARRRGRNTHGDHIDDARTAIIDAVSRWRAKAEHPLAPPSVVELSQIVVRTLEASLAEVDV
jgi:hypothetical protein